MVHVLRIHYTSNSDFAFARNQDAKLKERSKDGNVPNCGRIRKGSPENTRTFPQIETIGNSFVYATSQYLLCKMMFAFRLMREFNASKSCANLHPITHTHTHTRADIDDIISVTLHTTKL